MTATLALLQDTFREAMARKIFWGLFALATATILFFLFVMSIDVVAGVTATVSLFGYDVQQGMSLRRFVSEMYAAIAAFVYTLGMFLAVFASAGLVTSVLEPGRIELILSKPVARAHILLGRYAGNVLVIALMTTYLILGVWTVLGAKTGIWDVRFLAAAGMIVLIFSVLLTISVLVGVVWESAALAIMVTFFVMFISPVLAQKTLAERLLSSEWSRQVWRGLYYTLPKTYDLGRLTREIVLGQPVTQWMPVWSSLLFAAVMLAAAVLMFQRRDF